MRLADEIQELFEEAMREVDRLLLTEIQSATFSIGNWIARLWPRMPCEGWQDELDWLLREYARNHLFITDQSRADIIAWVTAANEEAKRDALLPRGAGPRLVDICYGPRPQPAALKSPYDKPAPIDPGYPELRRSGHLLMEQFPPADWLRLGTSSLKRHSVPEEVAKQFLQWLEKEQGKRLGLAAVAAGGDAPAVQQAAGHDGAASERGAPPAPEAPIVTVPRPDRALIESLRRLGAEIMRSYPADEWEQRAERAIAGVSVPDKVRRDFLAWIASESADRQHLKRLLDDAKKEHAARSGKAAPNATPRSVADYNQKLLDYHIRVMQQMVLVGDALFEGGRAALQRDFPWIRLSPATPLSPSPGYSGKLYVDRGTAGRVPFPENWTRLENALLYAMRFYGRIGFAGVTIISDNRSSTNMPGIPGVSIRAGAFTGTEFAAISELVHEAQHDFLQHGADFGVFPPRTHAKIKEIVPTVNPATSPAGDDFTQFVNFLMSIRTATNASLWDAIQREAGPQPSPP